MRPATTSRTTNRWPSNRLPAYTAVYTSTAYRSPPPPPLAYTAVYTVASVTTDRCPDVNSESEQALVQELVVDFGLDAETAEGMVTLAKKVVAREGRFSLEGMLRYARDAYAQDPLLRLYISGELPDAGN